eukprot:Filipodium_phascolosomae@DN6159_c0_g1_i1.p3
MGLPSRSSSSSGEILSLSIDPTADLNIPRCTIEDLRGGDAATNAAIITQAFRGGDKPAGPVGDTLILNAGMALWLVGATNSIEEGLSVARTTLASGAALKRLEEWQQYSQKHRK